MTRNNEKIQKNKINWIGSQIIEEIFLKKYIIS